MADDKQSAIWRDGTSQSGRVLPELDPNYAQVDERTTGDLLAFARAYATDLKYFALDDPDNAQGDWSNYLEPIADLDGAADYADNPEKFIADQAAAYSRPHFALFLTFLKLLEYVRGQFNAITRRHLEFYYRDVLKMVRKLAVPDQVHVLFELDNQTDQLLVPKGTALQAGKDSRGLDLVYRTDKDLVANKVQVAQVSSLHAAITVTGIKEANRQYLVSGTKNDAFVDMLKIALGQPNPGDAFPLPQYSGMPPAPPPGTKTDREIIFDALVQAQAILDILVSTLGMPFFDDFRVLMRLRELRLANDNADWKQINGFLEKAGKTRDSKFKLNPKDPRDFETNLRAALNKSADEFAHLYDGLPEVKSIDEAYAAYAKRADVQDFVKSKLYLALDDFKAMMQAKTLMDNQWNEIIRLLEAAGKRNVSPSFTLAQDVRASRDFDVMLNAAAPNFKSQYPAVIDAYYAAFLAIERAFFMSAENFAYMMAVAARTNESAADEWDWNNVYEIVTAAHRELIYAQRRDALLRVAQPDPNNPIIDSAKALGNVLTAVLGQSLSLNEAMQQLSSLGVTNDDLQYLQDVANNNFTLADWPRIYNVLEIAQRNRQNFKDPVAEKIEWRNLYPAPDARAISASSAQTDAQTLVRWKTFGLGEQPRSPEPAPRPTFGCAIVTPLLALAEGQRTITLTLGLSDDAQDFDPAKIRALFAPSTATPNTATFNPFLVEVSTIKGWGTPDAVKISWNDPNMDSYPAVPGSDVSKLKSLVITVNLSESQPALTPATRDAHGIDTAAPVLRIMLKPLWDAEHACYVTSYQILRTLRLLRARLAVSVSGLSSLTIANDQSTLDPKKPFEPFGNNPAVGSRFYLGHPEIVGKKLDTLSFRLTWMGVPSKLGDYYKNYAGNLTNLSFKAKIMLAANNILKDFSQPVALFDGDDATRPLAIVITPPSDQGDPASAQAGSTEITDWNRYLIWELNAPDFQHGAYPATAMQKSLQLASAISGAAGKAVDATIYQVNAPYTPKIKSLTADYSAAAEWPIGAPATASDIPRVIHIEPFGYREPQLDNDHPGVALLPKYEYEGELYIGLSNVTAPQNIALLLQMAEGSANPDLVPSPVEWSYLSGNRWLTLQDGSLLADATRGLINSGIIELALKPAQPNTLLSPELYWIRAAIARASDSVCDMVEIHPNAVLATFTDNDNAPDHLREPLPAKRITAPVTPIPGIAKVQQPYTSFGGKMSELDASFYVRVSERLRHKQRALTMWDYERLVLEKFPQIYKAKCLCADPIANPGDPGRIDVIVIPDIKNRLPFNPFEPKAPADLIRDIEIFLQDKTPPFAAIKIKNAHYVPLKVRCGVRFMPGEDEGYCRRRLNDELNRFLSPWAYEEGADLVIGGSVYANSIINFIDRRDYVDYIAEFKLFTSEDEGATFNLIPETDGYHARPKGPDGVLVAARAHEFDVISEADYRVEGYTGINYMRVELDFIVA